MIFQFLRHYFTDEEFEQTKIQLRESQNLLAEYKEFLQNEKGKSDVDKEKVDPDFLVMIWASIAFGLTVFTESIQKVVELASDRPVQFYIWLAFTLLSVVFTSYAAVFVLDLTRKYAKSKSDPQYITYAYYLIIGAITITVGVVIMGILG